MAQQLTTTGHYQQKPGGYAGLPAHYLIDDTTPEQLGLQCKTCYKEFCVVGTVSLGTLAMLHDHATQCSTQAQIEAKR